MSKIGVSGKPVDLKQIFKTPNPIIGVVHLQHPSHFCALGRQSQSYYRESRARGDSAGFWWRKRYYSREFFRRSFAKDEVDPAVVSAMTLVVQRLMNLVTLPIGVNVLRNDGKSAMAIASCTQAHFIRVNVLNGVMACDQD